MEITFRTSIEASRSGMYWLGKGEREKDCVHPLALSMLWYKWVASPIFFFCCYWSVQYVGTQPTPACISKQPSYNEPCSVYSSSYYYIRTSLFLLLGSLTYLFAPNCAGQRCKTHASSRNGKSTQQFPVNDLSWACKSFHLNNPFYRLQRHCFTILFLFCFFPGSKS